MNKDLKTYKAFIFDFDGTLVEPLHIDWKKCKKLLDAACLRHGLQTSQLPSIPEKLTYAFQYSQETKDEVVELMKSLEMPLLSSLIASMKICDVFKNALSTAPENVFIVSNNNSELISRFLETSGMSIPLRNIHSLDRMQLPKPSIYFYQSIHSVCPRKEDCVYFGDSYTDEIICKLLDITYIHEKTV